MCLVRSCVCVRCLFFRLYLSVCAQSCAYTDESTVHKHSTRAHTCVHMHMAAHL